MFLNLIVVKTFLLLHLSNVNALQGENRMGNSDEEKVTLFMMVIMIIIK